MHVPFVDLGAQYRAIRPSIDEAIRSVIRETAFVRGPYVSDFENAFAKKCNVKHCISVANGTDAIFITLKMLGIGPGDEVITTANSWISTSETISLTGAKPVFVDIEPDYYCIDPHKIEDKITSRTKAAVPVHLYGQPAETDAIKSICVKHGLFLVEDCAQAHFAEYKGRIVGASGTAGTFSFYPGKNLGAYGDAGAIITDNDDLAAKVRMFANHGSLVKHQHEIEGMNSRMDGLQAAILSAKLPYIDGWNRQRRENALHYSRLLETVDGITTPFVRSSVSHVFHLYVIRSPLRDDLRKYLGKNGVATGVHYPKALPFLRAYACFGHEPEDFPTAHRYQDEILSLPMYPELSQEQIE